MTQFNDQPRKTGNLELSPPFLATGVSAMLGLGFVLVWAVPLARAAPAGLVVAWGDHGGGPLTIVPPGVNGVTAVAAGFNHTIALRSDGTVAAWGDNLFGQTTGTPSTNSPYTDTAVPVTLNGLVRSGVVAIAGGGSQSVALLSNGTVVAWGRNDYGQVTVPDALTGVKAITAGRNHTAAVRADGTVAVWGDNFYGQKNVPAGLSGVVAIAAGEYHTVAVRTNGTVVAWGFNGYGGTSVPAGLNSVIAVSAGGNHTVALKADGTVVAWGDNGADQSSIPFGVNSVVAIAAGYYYTVALRSNGTVITWGNNSDGQTTGTPTTAFPNTATANPVTLNGLTLSGVAAIAASRWHTVALVTPRMTAFSIGRTMTLLWPAAFSGYRLESARSLLPPVSWSRMDRLS